MHTGHNVLYAVSHIVTSHIVCNVHMLVELQAQLERVLEGESRQLPWQHLAILFGLTLGEMLVTLHPDTVSSVACLL